MWQIVFAVIASKVVFGRAKKAWLSYKSLKDLRSYGDSVGIPYVPGEDVEKFRSRLIDARNKSAGTAR